MFPDGKPRISNRRPGAATALLLSLLLGSSALAQTPTLTVLTHDSFSLDKTLLEGFEKAHGVRLRLVKGGDAGQMVNKLILSRGSIADVVYGFDNILLPKALKAGVLEAGSAQWVNVGYVALNYDVAALKGKALPRSLEDLTRPEFGNLLVVQNPATSSPGLAFLLSSVKHFGETRAWQFWAGLRDNGLKVTNGWSDAYNTQFSKNGGKYPLVLSYSSSPAAELYFAEKKPQTPPTANLFLPGSTFRQLEGAALVKGSRQAALGRTFIAFLRSSAVQQNIPTEMWVYPVISGVKLDVVYAASSPPRGAYSPTANDPLVSSAADLIRKWTEVVIRGKKPEDVR